MLFEFKADCLLEAENIDEALKKISHHFENLVDDEDFHLEQVESGKNREVVILKGELTVRPRY